MWCCGWADALCLAVGAHQAILAAATEGDADQATELTRLHIQGFLDRLIDTMEVTVGEVSAD